ncbi:5-dehydro-2-deoxygluconokinase [Muricauda oceani]|uniref:5-dehydro-2-deoxygluconokinase n=1 Tax=Flagellimonas oceani TaxID=2698672 RepID=A0A6G7J3Q6_9FLAO|nr:5-dehydro-2-deoxygluconokinase [Allomuricauda oceani]MBW8244131.1 5-dehydro-2-deoxygluconokinase [Allomuricauda oceani]QII45102.1 5-dehydro-2-deoxygluconokinase [Allomuricauda oceani]
MDSKKYDVITLGRSSIDLYSQNIGSPFNEIKGFDAFVGGSPLNIAVACSRLGLQSSLLTAVGNDKVGEFIINFLNSEKVNTECIPIKNGARSSAVVLGIEPPDKFPLVFYRDNAADSQLDIDDVLAANISDYRVLLINGTAMNVEPSRSATFFATEIAEKNDVDIVLDLDFRADQWHDYRAFGITMRAILPKVKIAIGTEEEILAATLSEASQVVIKHQQISAPEITGDIEKSIAWLLSSGIETLLVKRGGDGVSIYTKDGSRQDVPGFPVEVVNVLGAGDAFAGGFIYGLLKGWDLYKSCRMGNASGAQVVTKKGCANFMPTIEESLKFIEDKGGF